VPAKGRRSGCQIEGHSDHTAIYCMDEKTPGVESITSCDPRAGVMRSDEQFRQRRQELEADFGCASVSEDPVGRR
jgi:hypothetical protein